MTEIKSIAGPLRELLAEREIIARCELLLRTYQIVRDAELSEEERAELKALVGERIAPGVFASIKGNLRVDTDRAVVERLARAG